MTATIFDAIREGRLRAIAASLKKVGGYEKVAVLPHPTEKDSYLVLVQKTENHSRAAVLKKEALTGEDTDILSELRKQLTYPKARRRYDLW